MSTHFSRKKKTGYCNVQLANNDIFNGHFIDNILLFPRIK